MPEAIVPITEAPGGMSSPESAMIEIPGSMGTAKPPTALPYYTAPDVDNAHVCTYVGYGNVRGDGNHLREEIGNLWSIESMIGEDQYLKPNNLPTIKTENLNGIEVHRAVSRSPYIRTVEINPCTVRIPDSNLAVPNYLIPIRMYSHLNIPGGDLLWNKLFKGGAYGERSFPGLIPSNTLYYDTMFKYTKPYSVLEKKKSNIRAIGNTLNMSYQYRAHLKDYEATVNQMDSELLIPNYYTYQYLSDANIDYRKYATLNGRFTPRSVYNRMFDGKLKAYKYLDESFPSADFTEGLKSNVINSQKNIIFDDVYYKTITEGIKSPTPVNNFPYYVTFKFPEHTGREPDNSCPFIVRDSIAKHDFSSKFLEILKDVYDVNFPGISPTLSTFTVQNTSLTGAVNYGRSSKLPAVESSRVSKQSLKSVDFIEFLTLIYNNYSSSLNNDYSFAGPKRAPHDSTYSATGFDRYYNNKATVAVLDEVIKYSYHILNKDPLNYLNLKNVINLQQNPVETLAYRVEKIGGTPTLDSNTENVLQNFWFFNSKRKKTRSRESPEFDFVDTQVKYGGKYTYNLYAYALVPSYRYKFTNLRLTKQIARIDTDGDGIPDLYCMQFYNPANNNFANQVFYDNATPPGTATPPPMPPTPDGSMVPVEPGSGWYPGAGEALESGGPGSSGGGGGGGATYGGFVPMPMPMVPTATGWAPPVPGAGGWSMGTPFTPPSPFPAPSAPMSFISNPNSRPSAMFAGQVESAIPSAMAGAPGTGGGGVEIDWDSVQQMSGGGGVEEHETNNGGTVLYDTGTGKCWASMPGSGPDAGEWVDCCEYFTHDYRPTWCDSDGHGAGPAPNNPGGGETGLGGRFSGGGIGGFGPGGSGDFNPHVQGAGGVGDGGFGNWLSEISSPFGDTKMVVNEHTTLQGNDMHIITVTEGSGHTTVESAEGTDVYDSDGNYVGTDTNGDGTTDTYYDGKGGAYDGQGFDGAPMGSEAGWDSDGGADAGGGAGGGASDGGGASGEDGASGSTDGSDDGSGGTESGTGDDGDDGDDGDGYTPGGGLYGDHDNDGILNYMDPDYTPYGTMVTKPGYWTDGGWIQSAIVGANYNGDSSGQSSPGALIGLAGPVFSAAQKGDASIITTPKDKYGVPHSGLTGIKAATPLGDIYFEPQDGSSVGGLFSEGKDWRIGLQITIGNTVGDGSTHKYNKVQSMSSTNQPSGGSTCVLAGTLIETERGRVPVEEITTSDKTYSYDFEKEEYGYYNIVDVMTPSERSRWAMVTTTSGKSIKCTEEHPLYTLNSEDNKLPVNEANIGDIVHVFINGKLAEDSIESIQYFEENITVYNFEVDEVHSYISDEILSHNKVIGTGGRTGGPGLPDTPRGPLGPLGGPGTTQQMSYGSSGGPHVWLKPGDTPATFRTQRGQFTNAITDYMRNHKRIQYVATMEYAARHLTSQMQRSLASRPLIAAPAYSMPGSSMGAGGGGMPAGAGPPVPTSGGGSSFTPGSPSFTTPSMMSPGATAIIPPITVLIPDCRTSILAPRNRYATLQQDLSDSPHVADVYMQIEPCFKLIEIPIYSKTQMVLDHPGNKASIYPFQYLDDSNRLGFEVSYESYVPSEFPTVITTADQLLKDNYLFANNKMPKDLIKTKSVSRARYIEVYRLKTKPRSFEDFSGHMIKMVDLRIEETDYVYADTIYEAEANTNEKYYYLFRFLNEHFMICHPSEILECELVEDGGYKYATFGVMYEEQLRHAPPRNTTIQMKKLLQIQPNMSHLMLTTDQVDFSAPTTTQLNKVGVGKAKDLIWGKTFKLRLTSKKTGRKLDLNVNFKIEEDPEPPTPTIPAGVLEDVPDSESPIVFDPDSILIADSIFDAITDSIESPDSITISPGTTPWGGPGEWTPDPEDYDGGSGTTGLPDGWSVVPIEPPTSFTWWDPGDTDASPGFEEILEAGPDAPESPFGIPTETWTPEFVGDDSPLETYVVTDKFWWED